MAVKAVVASVAVPEKVGVLSVVGSGERAVTETVGAVASTVKVSDDSEPPAVVLPLESVARTYIVWDPSERADETVQENVSEASSNVPSSAVHDDQEPAVESIWNCTAETVPIASVAVPVNVGVLSLFGSGESAVNEILGAVLSKTILENVASPWFPPLVSEPK